MLSQSKIKYSLKYGIEQEKPIISVLMPIYNHPDFLEESIRSVINQKFNFPFELIIIDNNHPDCQHKNEAIIKSINNNKVLYYVNDSNIGPCENWNRAIDLSHADYIIFCHDDDLLYSETLAKLWGWHLKTNDNSMIIGSFDVINEKGEFSYKESSRRDYLAIFRKKDLFPLSRYDFLISNYTNGCGCLYKKESGSYIRDSGKYAGSCGQWIVCCHS